jgi:hypothetical protein
MKKLILIFLFLCSIKTYAQKTGKVTSIYYLIDTAKVPVNARMWDIHMEYPSLKLYTIECPCMQYGQKPTFVYDTSAIRDYVINKKKLSTIKFTSLTVLILKSKQITTIGSKGRYSIFIVEPKGEKYVVHPVRLIKPLKPRDRSIDYENMPLDTSKIKKP